MKEIPAQLLRAFLGPRGAFNARRRAVRAAQDYRTRLAHAIRRCSPELEPSIESPVFILSAGWRSGSTLLQRMVMQHNDELLIWGEPFNQCRVLDSLADQFRGFGPRWPKESHFLSKRAEGDLAQQWVANLYPDVDDLVRAHRDFFQRLFAAPAKRHGRTQWGIKAVRLTIDHASYLRWLFPRAKLLLLYRDPSTLTPPSTKPRRPGSIGGLKRP